MRLRRGGLAASHKLGGEGGQEGEEEEGLVGGQKKRSANPRSIELGYTGEGEWELQHIFTGAYHGPAAATRVQSGLDCRLHLHGVCRLAGAAQNYLPGQVQ